MKKILLALMLMLLALLTVTALAECHHTYDMVDVKKVTCTTDGYYLLKCNSCGHTVKEITDKAWGHDWAYVSGQDANCAEKGYKKYACNNCGDSKTESIPAKGHNWKDSKVLEEATCTRDGSMRTVCKVCGLSGTRKIEKSHKYGAWAVTEEATDHSKGTRTRTCKVCKKKQTESFYPEGTLYKNIKNKKDEVKELQQLLTDLGFLNDKVDGIFGAKTEKAVKACQKEYGLKQDGIAWPQTLHTLGVAWDVAFGEPEENGGAAFPLFCQLLVLEDESECWDTCVVHSEIFMFAADELPEDAGEADVLNAYIAAWQTELDRLYQAWLEGCAPEEQPMVINHKTMFQGYLNSQQLLWRAQHGDGAVKALENTNAMLMEQCYTLCSVVHTLLNGQ
jgi:hypothetical protein